ncbi:MAG: DUF3488 and transglutaminase-like domain-containing protein [Acidobacteriota bacterium]
MFFARQKRLMLGMLALLAPLPLPLNAVLPWPVLLLFWLGVAFFMRRAAQGATTWLSPWMMNLLGAAYLPFFFFDLTVLGGGRLVGPVIRMGLFAILVKLFSMRRERDKWQALMAIFFLFLASMATSVHPSIMFYLVVFLVGALYLLIRFAFLHIVAGFGQRDPQAAQLPLKGFLFAGVVTTLLFAVPLFALLPRVSTPYVTGRGSGTGTTIQAMGFSDEVTLDSIGRIRESREVALRMRYDDPAANAQDRRLKAATFDLYQGRSWRRSPVLRTLVKEDGAMLRLVEGPPQSWVNIWLQPLSSRSLPLPTDTRMVSIDRRGLEVGRGGAVYMTFPPIEVLEYRVAIATPEASAAEWPDADDGTLDTTGVSDRMVDLAAEMMGQGDLESRIRNLENHLATRYTYTLDFVGREGRNPLEEFLFTYRSGHCEYFASAMVLLLRSQGVHARLVTGFVGGEVNALEGYTVVRQSNAHAWVEAFLPDQGWRQFDPTPAAGRPETREPNAWSLATQAWDFLIFRWDRYVLTYGFSDQLELFGNLRELWRRLWTRQPKPAAQPTPSAEPTFEPETPPAPVSGSRWQRWLWPLLLAPGVVLLVGLVAWWRRRAPLSATRAYRRLRRELERAGFPVAQSLAPLSLSAQAGERFPASAEAMAKIVRHYVAESFGGRTLEADELGEVGEALLTASKGLRTSG